MEGANLAKIIDQVGKEKGIDKSVIIEALEAAMITAAKKKLGIEHDIEAQFNEEIGEVELFEFKTVAKEVKDPVTQISLEKALELDPDTQEGDSLGVKMDTTGLGRIAAQTAKQVIIQKVRDAEKGIIYSEFIDRKGEVISGIVRRVEKGGVIVDLGRTEGYIPHKEMMPSEHFRAGDRVQCLLLDVLKDTPGFQLILSRAHPKLLVKLFEMEVPEVNDGIVEIKSAAREPGSRAKISVYSKDSDVDPVGACVGMRGSRVQNVVRELRGEKIDIVPFSPDPTTFVCSALAPAQISKVLVDEKNKSMEIIVADDQLALAIGKRGQNVRLASELSGWRIDIMSESKSVAEKAIALKRLQAVDGISETVAITCYHHGITKPEDLVRVPAQDISKITGYDEGKSQELLDKVKAWLKDHSSSEITIEKEKKEELPKKEEAQKESSLEESQGKEVQK
ncbi:MAG: transcription termination/antitermination protein NusA [Deltaproteobacteria bacterium]|nr:transcription termination/antitermination protein NusA [Deltaproteobacteria bacterium]